MAGKVETWSNPLYGFGGVVKLYSAFELNRTTQLICTRNARVGVTMFSERTLFALQSGQIILSYVEILEVGVGKKGTGCMYQ